MVTPAPGTPAVTPQMPGVPMIKSGEKSESGEQPFKPYLAVLWSGVGQVMFELDVSSDISAAFAGYFLAMRHYPSIHTVAVWKKKGPTPEEIIDPPVLYLVLVGLDTECSPTISQLTGQAASAPPSSAPPSTASPVDGTGTKKSTPGAIPLKTPEQGFEEMKKQLKTSQQGRKQ